MASGSYVSNGHYGYGEREATEIVGGGRGAHGGGVAVQIVLDGELGLSEFCDDGAICRKGGGGTALISNGLGSIPSADWRRRRWWSPWTARRGGSCPLFTT